MRAWRIWESSAGGGRYYAKWGMEGIIRKGERIRVKLRIYATNAIECVYVNTQSTGCLKMCYQYFKEKYYRFIDNSLLIFKR